MHTYRNILKRMAALRNLNSKLQKQLSDIQNLQWSCHSEKCFLVGFDLLEKKYVYVDFLGQEKLLLANFFEYFRGQWGPGSHVFRFAFFVFFCNVQLVILNCPIHGFILDFIILLA